MSKKSQQHQVSSPHLVTLSLAPLFDQTQGKTVNKRKIYYGDKVRQDNNQDIFNTFILSCTEEINLVLLHPIKIPVQTSEKGLYRKR